MAVLYKPHSSGKTLLIGGQSTTTGASGGLVGPFPKFSIDREELSTPDGTYLGTKFSINITGIATLNSGDSQDITQPGERQDAVMGASLTALQLDRDTFPTQGAGLLQITPYGGLSNTIEFNDARLLSVSLPEQQDESAGVQNLEYSFSFEAYQDTSNNSSSGSTGTTKDPTYKLSSAEESWDLSENDSVFFKSNNPNSTLNKTFTLTHSLKATGLKDYASLSTLDTNGEAWRQAALWVKDRLKTCDSIKNPITQDLTGDSSFWLTQFVPVNMNKESDATIAPDLKNSTPSYKGFNHVRTINSDLSAGTYSVEESWLLSASDLTATHEIEVSVEDDKGPFVTVAVNANFQGLNSSNFNDEITIDKFDQAEASYTAMKDKFYTLANSAYGNFDGEGNLRNEKISESYGENRTTGTITYSVTFNDDVILLENAFSESISINYDNDEGLNEVIAKIPIIGREEGPIIQDMNTTTIKIVTGTLDAQMKRGFRTTKPTAAATAILEQYKPDNSFQQAKTESWEIKSGTYNLSISWECNVQ